MEFRSMLGGAITVIFLLMLQISLVGAARRRAKLELNPRQVKLWDLIVTSEDNHYSLSRLQMYLWTLVVVVAYVMVFLYKYDMPAIPDTLYMLMGVNLAAAVGSTAIAMQKGVQKREGRPDFIRDIFFENEDSLDLPRTQMFIWTVVSLLVFVVVTVKGFMETNPVMPAIPTGLVVLMGISHAAYLGSKATAKEETGDTPK